MKTISSRFQRVRAERSERNNNLPDVENIKKVEDFSILKKKKDFSFQRLREKIQHRKRLEKLNPLPKTPHMHIDQLWQDAYKKSVKKMYIEVREDPFLKSRMLNTLKKPVNKTHYLDFLTHPPKIKRESKTPRAVANKTESDFTQFRSYNLLTTASSFSRSPYQHKLSSVVKSCTRLLETVDFSCVSRSKRRREVRPSTNLINCLSYSLKKKRETEALLSSS